MIYLYRNYSSKRYMTPTFGRSQGKLSSMGNRRAEVADGAPPLPAGELAFENRASCRFRVQGSGFRV